MKNHFEYQLANSKPLSYDDVLSMIKVRKELEIPYDEAEILSWEGRTLLYYCLHDKEKNIVEIKRLFSDDLDTLNQYKYEHAGINNIPRFSK